MNLISFQHNGLDLLIRDGPSTDSERDIVREVQREYDWGFPIGTAIDIGAHIGAWTKYAKTLHPNARIVAVEVDLENFEILTINTSGLSDVTCLHARAGYEQGQFMVARNTRNSGSTFVFPNELGGHFLHTLSDHDVFPAPNAVTLGEIMLDADMPHVDVLKLDCEGAEVGIVNHVSDDVLTRIQRIVGEIHTTPDVFEADTEKRLQQNGFRVEYRPHPADTSLFYIHAWR